MKVTVR